MGDFLYSMGDSSMVLTARFRLTRTCSDLDSDLLGTDFVLGIFT